MSTVRKKKSKPANDQPPTTENRTASLWSVHGMDDVNYQRGAQVTWWTIMGGLAAAALVTELGDLWTQMQAGRWYLGLFFVNSFLTIVLGWTLMAWGSLVLKYPITVANTILIIGTSFALVIQCLQVSHPIGWLAATGVSGVFVWLQQIYFMKSGAWEPFPAETIVHLRKNLWVYGLWPLICFVGVFHLFVAPSVIVETIWGVIALAVLIDALFRRDRDMQREKIDLGIP